MGYRGLVGGVGAGAGRAGTVGGFLAGCDIVRRLLCHGVGAGSGFFAGGSSPFVVGLTRFLTYYHLGFCYM